MQNMDTPISLSECHRRLIAEMGDQAPAAITLKRWKRDGRLEKAIVRSTERGAGGYGAEKSGGRTARFRFAEVLKIARGASLATRPQIKAVRRAASVSSADGLSSEVVAQLGKTFSDQVGAQVSAALKAWAPSASEAGEGHRALLAAATNLEATRRQLMIKYDAEITALKERVAQLVTQVRGVDAIPLELGKLNLRLGELKTMLESR
jgi:hypothetical protein